MIFNSPILTPKPSIQTYSWATGTIDQINTMFTLSDAGIINLSDYWNIGDIREIQLSEIAEDSLLVTEYQPSQTIQLVIMDFYCNGFSFTSNNKKPHAIVGLKDGLSRYGIMHNRNTNIAWDTCKRREWCNYNFKNSFPLDEISLFKQFQWKIYDSSKLVTINDYFALPLNKCIFGNSGDASQSESALYNQWDWYKTPSNRLKKDGPNGTEWWWFQSSIPYSSSYSRKFCIVYGDGNSGRDDMANSNLISPFGCI